LPACPGNPAFLAGSIQTAIQDKKMAMGGERCFGDPIIFFALCLQIISQGIIPSRHL
jgi:hypothetical protein